MDKELFDRVKGFRTSVAVVKGMLSNGLISENDYAVICTVLAKKHGLKSSTIFSEMDLIIVGNNGNIPY